ncbi:MAG: thermonuclease family protein, partial [Vicinamibacterales bacterium]
MIHQSAFLDGNHLVSIEHVTAKDVDRYGRFVSRVSVGGEDLSLALVAAGLAWRSRPRMGRSAAGTISFDTQVDTLAAAHCGTHT